MQKRFQRVHFVGIGGIGMSGIAEVLLNLGYHVSGSDLGSSDITRRLRSLGAKVYKGHRSSHVDSPDAVVVSSAVANSNPEIVKAKRLNIPVIPRAEMLAELMRMKRGIAIAGTHGKTTTTSILGSLLTTCGVDPTVVIGGKLNIWGTNAKLGQGDTLVAEADESDGSFHLLSPTIAVVTNIDDDHLDHYGSLKNIKSAFVTFLNKLPFYGVGIVCGDDKHIKSILKGVNKRIITYGTSSQCDYRAANMRSDGLLSSFDVMFQNKKLGRVQIKVPGLHNILNALAALVVARELDLPFKAICRGLAMYKGVQRRFQVRGSKRGVTVVDDYGHHPTEIKSVLSTAKKVWPTRRLIVVFQPHRFSRTKALLKEFLTSFRQADVVVGTEIYAASEKKIPGISGKSFFQQLQKRNKHVHYVPRGNDLAKTLKQMVTRGDVVLTLGAGDIWKCGEQLLSLLKK